MTFLTRSLRYSLMATTALTLNTLTPAWSDQTNACRDIIVHSEAQRHQQALEQSFHLFKNNGNGLPQLHTPSETYTYSKEAYRIDWQLEDARAKEKLDEWEGGIGGAFYHFERRGNITIVNAILSMHIANTEQGMSRQDSAQKLFTYFLNMYRVTDECDNLIPNGLVEVWNDLDEDSRKRHIRSIMFGDNRKDKLLLDLLIQSGGHGITVTYTTFPYHSRINAQEEHFMDLATKIQFRGNLIEPWDITLRKAQELYPHIQALKARNFQLNDANAVTLAAALAQYHHITSLDLWANGIGDAGATALARNATLRELYLGDNQISAAGAAQLAGNTTLRKLDLTNNQIDTAGAIALARNTTLRELYLSRNRITAQGATQLAGNRSLQKLDLVDNLIGTEGAIALAGNTNLQVLHLTRNLIGPAAAIALARNTTLRELYLDANQIGDTGAISLAGNTTLQELDLSWNRIGDEGATALAGNTTLRKLYLGDNQIRDAGAIALAGNTTLQELDLSQNLIGDAGAREFLRLLIQNKSPLKKLDIRENDAITQSTKDEFRAWATANGVELRI